MKKLLAALLSLMLCFSAAMAEGGMKMADEKVTFTVLQAINDNLNFDADTNYAIQWLEEQTNVKLDYEFVKTSDWETKFNLAMVSGDLPDIVWSFNRLDDEEYGVIQKLFIPVDELIDKYMPNLKALIAQDPTSMAASYASDGHIYGLPGYYDNYGVDAVGFQFINQTWLNNLNLQTPTTVEALTEVLRAFKTQDPNGNGLADEIPYSCSFNDHINAGLWSLFFYFGIPTDGSTFFSLDEEGVVTFDPYRPGFRAAVEWMHTLYAEGLMDMEALTQDVATFTSKLNDGTIGFMPFWRLSSMGIDDVKDNYSMLLPVSAEGYKALRHKEASFARPRVYLTNPETAEFLARYFDQQLNLDVQYTTFYGEKDVDWTVTEDGLYKGLTSDHDAPNRGKSNCSFMFRNPQIYEKIEISAGGLERLAYSKAHNEAGVVQKYSNSLMKTAVISADDASRLALSLVDIQKAVKEFVSKGVIKGVTDESWNEFMSDCQTLNVQDYLDTYNAAMDKTVKE